MANREDKRFTVTSGRFNYRAVHYVYRDPVTGKVTATSAKIEDVASIVIGKHVGNAKHNPKTGEYFPSMYNFDPYTGDKLVWCERRNADGDKK